MSERSDEFESMTLLEIREYEHDDYRGELSTYSPIK